MPIPYPTTHPTPGGDYIEAGDLRESLSQAGILDQEVTAALAELLDHWGLPLAAVPLMRAAQSALQQAQQHLLDAVAIAEATIDAP